MKPILIYPKTTRQANRFLNLADELGIEFCQLSDSKATLAMLDTTKMIQNTKSDRAKERRKPSVTKKTITKYDDNGNVKDTKTIVTERRIIKKR